MSIKRIPDNRDVLTRQAAQVTQFGRLETSSPRIVLSIQGRYGVLPARETALQIDGSDLGSALTSTNAGTTQIDSGTVATESIRLESNEYLEYSPQSISEASSFIYRDTGPTDDQVLRFGLLNSEDGLFFRETADALEMVIRKGGTDKTLDDFPAASVQKPNALTKDLLDDGRVWFIAFSYYGAGEVIFGTREPRDADIFDPGSNQTIYGVYFPTKDETNNGPFMRTANLPSVVEIENDPEGSTSPSELTVYTGERVIVEYDQRDTTRRKNTHLVGPLEVSTSREGLVAIRPASTFQGNINDVNVRIVDVLFDTTDLDQDVEIWTTLGSEITATWTDSPYSEPESAVEIAEQSNITSVDTLGRQVPPRLIARSTQNRVTGKESTDDEEIPLGKNQIFLVEGESASGNPGDLYIRLEWTESH
jgi:hypothetical protein